MVRNAIPEEELAAEVRDALVAIGAHGRVALLVVAERSVAVSVHGPPDADGGADAVRLLIVEASSTVTTVAGESGLSEVAVVFTIEMLVGVVAEHVRRGCLLLEVRCRRGRLRQAAEIGDHAAEATLPVLTALEARLAIARTRGAGTFVANALHHAAVGAGLSLLRRAFVKALFSTRTAGVLRIAIAGLLTAKPPSLARISGKRGSICSASTS